MKLCSLGFTVLIITLPILAENISEESAWKLGWPRMQGPHGNFHVPQTGTELVEDLSNARMVWESDTRDFGRAKHTTGSFKGKTPQERAQKIRDILGPSPKSTPGGWAAPIIAEGKVFTTSFKPAGKLYDVKVHPSNEYEKKNPTTAKGYLEAVDLVIALDSKTGKTIWRTEESGGFVWGVGKRMGFQVAPVYHEGVLFSMGTTGRVFAYQASNGKKLWQTPALEHMVEERNKHLARSYVLQASANYGWLQSLVFAGETLIVPRQDRLLGIDPNDGNKKWELSKVISRWSTPTIWHHKNKDYLLCATGGKPGGAKLSLVDPSKGEVLWTIDGLHSTQFNLSPSDQHVLVNVGSKILKEKPNASAPKNPDGTAPFSLLGAYKLSTKSAELVWTLPDKPHFLTPAWSDSLARPRTLIRNGYVYFSTEGPDKANDRRFIIVKEDTGEVLVDVPRENDFWFQLIEDKLLHCIDWSHGSRASFNLYSADPKNFRKLSGPWKPDHPLTTSYQVLMEPPVIAGRIFWRTETGSIVCYDLRKR